MLFSFSPFIFSFPKKTGLNLPTIVILWQWQRKQTGKWLVLNLFFCELAPVELRWPARLAWHQQANLPDDVECYIYCFVISRQLGCVPPIERKLSLPSRLKSFCRTVKLAWNPTRMCAVHLSTLYFTAFCCTASVWTQHDDVSRHAMVNVEMGELPNPYRKKPTSTCWFQRESTMKE